MTDDFTMVKEVEIDQEWMKEARDAELGFVPLYIVDGNEKAEGTGAIEIDFDKVNSEDDIMIDFDVEEVESLDTEKGKMVCWIETGKLAEVEKIDIYYGDSS